MKMQIEDVRADGIAEAAITAQPGSDTVAIPLVSGDELLASTVQPAQHLHGDGPMYEAASAAAAPAMHAEVLASIDVALKPVQQPAPVAEPHYEAGRKQGRAEALVILMQLDPEGGIDQYTGWSTPAGPEDEGSAYWEEEKLRELFGADSALADMMDRAEAEYWKYLGMQDEAERAKNFAVNMHSSGRVREVLAQAAEFDLMGKLCTAAPVAAPVAGQEPFMYGIMGPDGKAYYEEHCVDPTPEALYSAVNALNDSPDTGYKVVPMFAAAVPAASVQPDGIASYTPGRWFDARTVDEMQAFYMSRLPAIRKAAHDHGYAIGLHGSARRDFDLMAMQWCEVASDRDSLARAIADAACGIRREGAYDWEQKPNHRVATSIPICWTDHGNPDFDNMISAGHIDLSMIDAPKCEAAQPDSGRDAALEEAEKHLQNLSDDSTNDAAKIYFAEAAAVIRALAAHPANVAQAGELSTASVLEQAAQACDQQADGTNGPYRSACLQCANAVRALRDAAAKKGPMP